MTADLINLRRERKRRARASQEETADAWRMPRGIGKAELARAQADRALVDRRLAAHRRTPDADPGNA